MRNVVRSVAMVGVVVGIAACNPTNSQTVNVSDNGSNTGATYTPFGVMSANVTTTASGLKIDDLKVGSGVEAKSGDIVRMLYAGYLESGVKFDSATDPAKPFEFTLGAGRVIAGWDQGIVGMKEGGERQLVIPPQLGYGTCGSGPIPANSTLIFTVTLLDVVNR